MKNNYNRKDFFSRIPPYTIIDHMQDGILITDIAQKIIFLSTRRGENIPLYINENDILDEEGKTVGKMLLLRDMRETTSPW